MNTGLNFFSFKGALCIMAFLFGIFSCGTKDTEALFQHPAFDQAAENAIPANEALHRSDRFVKAWLEYADPASGLIPRNLYGDIDIWNAKDAAADNYPFMVLTSFFTDQPLYQGKMREMLDAEMRLTSRVQSLPDTYSFSNQGFQKDEVFMPDVLFGATEYIKDGLLPLTEWLGQSAWFDRMMQMLRDMDELVDVADGFESGQFGNAPVAEVNGELLQILSRVYWMTGEKQWLDWAVQIGDYFLLGEGNPVVYGDYLRLRDHGCELISGLCELYITTHVAMPEKKEAYQEALYNILDYILESGRNEDGFFYNAINPRTGEVVDARLADTWGYTLNGYLGVYMIDSIPAYKEAVTHLFSNLHKYRNYDWERGSADGYADAIESAINLFNRISDAGAEAWADSEIKVMWSMQDSSHRAGTEEWIGTGIIEGWHGDGNFARTSIMYYLWKTQGTWLEPWNEQLYIGAVSSGDSLFVSVRSESAWEGNIYFDQARHRTHFSLPLDWPRINQLPEWFTVEAANDYLLFSDADGISGPAKGIDLHNGVKIKLQPNQTLKLCLVKGY